MKSGNGGVSLPIQNRKNVGISPTRSNVGVRHVASCFEQPTSRAHGHHPSGNSRWSVSRWPKLTWEMDCTTSNDRVEQRVMGPMSGSSWWPRQHHRGRLQRDPSSCSQGCRHARISVINYLVVFRHPWFKNNAQVRFQIHNIISFPIMIGSENKKSIETT